MQSSVIFRFEADQHPELEAVKATVRTIDMQGVGDHARLRRLVTNQWKQEINLGGEDDAAAQAEKTKEVDLGAPGTILVREEEAILLETYLRWCAISASTVSVKVVRKGKKVKDLDPEDVDGWPWEESSMAALGWDKPQGILKLPIDLVGAWQTQAEYNNPGIFGRPLTSNYGPKKKPTTGVLSIT